MNLGTHDEKKMICGFKQQKEKISLSYELRFELFVNF